MTPQEWIDGGNQVLGQMDNLLSYDDFMEPIDRKILALLFESARSKIQRAIDQAGDYVEHDQAAPIAAEDDAEKKPATEAQPTGEQKPAQPTRPEATGPAPVRPDRGRPGRR